jgi:DNA-binding MarR family transcriptional regulator
MSTSSTVRHRLATQRDRDGRSEATGGRAAIDRVLSELGELSVAQDRLDQFAAERLGLNRTDQRALDLVGRAGSIAPTALARALGMSTGATSTVLDRLEAAGFIDRRPDPRRRRGTVVLMTDDARIRCSAIFDPVIAATALHAQLCSDAELTVISEFLASHRAALNDHLDSIPAGSRTDSAAPTAE